MSRPGLLMTLLLLVAVPGCGGADPAPGAPSEPVRGTIGLDRVPAGAPDGGTTAGHRGGYEASVEGEELAFAVALSPTNARLALAGAVGTVARRAGGAWTVRLRGLGARQTVRLTARALGRTPWREQVRVTRATVDQPSRREPQGVEPNRGPPGNGDASGGRLDVDIEDFAFSPARLVLRAGAQVVWRNQDRAEHALAPVTGPAKAVLPRSGRLQTGDRFDLTTLRPGRYRYHCAIHLWMEGELVAAAR